MALSSGRVGVRNDQVDPYGRLAATEVANKVKEQVGDFSFRVDEDGNAQYKSSEEGDWSNFSSGGGTPTLLFTNPSVSVSENPLFGYLNCNGVNSQSITLNGFNVDDYDFYFFECTRAGTNTAVIKSFTVLHKDVLKNCNNNSRAFPNGWTNNFSNNIQIVNNHIVIPATSTSSGFGCIYKVYGLKAEWEDLRWGI